MWLADALALSLPYRKGETAFGRRSVGWNRESASRSKTDESM
jgi:hypothetical protein